MTTLLFSLRGVPEDEADEVRALLAEHAINFYETSAGNWGISMPALWLNDDVELPRARQLLHDYQQHRAITQRALYLQRKQAGEEKTFWQSFFKKPLLYLIYFLAMSLVLYVSVQLLFDLGL